MGAPDRILIVGGHDPSGAGIDADRAALVGIEVEGLTVVTARTDQDASAVRSIGARDPKDWTREALDLGGDGFAVVKFGLLPGREHVLAARDLLLEVRRSARSEVPAVVDPVIRASSGGRFLDDRAVEALRQELLPEGVVLTPNLAEAAELTGIGFDELEGSLEGRGRAAQALLESGARAVVVKGGHGREDPVRDLIATREGSVRWITRPRLAGGSIRGSGCRFATRLAARWALGMPLEDAVEDAGRFVAEEIERAMRAGRAGRG